MNPLIIAPSLLACDFANLAKEIGRVEAGGGDWLHVDVMDGHFVPNITLGPPVVAKIHAAARIPLDVHLMIEEPLRAGGVPLVGVSINPDTPVSRVRAVLDEVDLILVMSVFPGFGGQEFMPEVLEKVQELRALGYSGWLEMDGGLDRETIPRCAAAGADVLVAGSAIFGAEDLAGTIERFREAAETARVAAARRDPAVEGPCE